MKKTITIAVTLAALFTVSHSLAQTSRTADVQFKAAQHKEEVEGDLKGAIEQYKKLAGSSDRTIAARALIHMAECYQKLGDSESRNVYERIVREFADQADQVALARTRLGGGADQTRSASERPIPIDPESAFVGTVSSDGRFISYLERSTQNVFVRDLKTGTDRLLSKGVVAEIGGTGGYPIMSRDGKQVAFDRHLSRTRGEVELSIVNNAPAPGAPQVRRLLAFKEPAEIAPRDWSPDGKWIAALFLQPDAKIALVSAENGSVRMLKSLQWGFPRNIFFSPDSRYIAYSLPVLDTRNQTDVLILAVDGSRETTVIHHPSLNNVMGWSPDGASLLFASDRNGSIGLWSLPVSDGKAQGSPVLVSQTLGPRPVSLGVTASGILYVWRLNAKAYVQVSPVDLSIGKILPDPVKLRVFVGQGGKPSWSPDGNYLAYESCPEDCDSSSTINIRNMETGQVRELWPAQLRYLQSATNLAWSADGRSITVFATDMKGRLGNYVIDTQTGETSPTTADLPGFTNVTADGAKRYRALGGSIVETANGKDRVIFQERAPGNRVLAVSSADRRYTAIVETTNSQTATLLIMPYGGGNAAELLHTTAVGFFDRGFSIEWTPDSRAILAIKRSGPSKELWLVPISEGQPRKLDIEVDNWSTSFGFQLRRDGRQIAFVTGENKDEILALENFLPANKTRR